MPTSRPCKCDRPGCDVCRLWYTSARHRVAWGGPAEQPALPPGDWLGAAPPAGPPPKRERTEEDKARLREQLRRVRLPCVHRAAKPHANPSCGCSVYRCGLHGECTTQRTGYEYRDCMSCPDYSRPDDAGQSKVTPEVA